MASHGCINGTLDGNNYSSTVPLIGLYIVAATLVCMLLMIYDTLVGIYTRKSWLPCKMFKLDSITLTLVSVAVKLTVDLTTPMPSVWDQLSKLCGICLLCAYMGFIMPSVGVMNDSTNMHSLSILVITVFVNTCIQISTGVVVLFIPEHIIVLCIMLLLLWLLWLCAKELKDVKRYTRETSKSLFTRNKETVLERLKKCYLYGYGSNSQFMACKDQCFSTCMGGLNLICLAILIQATYRSVIIKSEKFCRGNSDYEWSMPIIVLAHILTVVVGSFVSISRWLAMDEHVCELYKIAEGEPYESNPIWKESIRVRIIKYLWDLPLVIIFGVFFIIVYPLLACFIAVKYIFDIFRTDNNNAVKEEFKCLINTKLGIDQWTLWKGLKEMEKEIKVHKREPNHLFQLLSRITPSQQLLLVEHSKQVDPNGETVPVSTLSMVLLVKISQVSLPKDLNRYLVKTFRDVYSILCFIEKTVSSTNTEFAKKFEVAKAVWLAGDFSHLVVKTIDECATGQGGQSPSTALAIITEIKTKMPEDMISKEISSIQNFINRRQYSSIKELYDFIEQLYVDMLHVILAQFPIAAFDALAENPSDSDYHKRVRLVLKCFSKIEPLEAQINWKFPQECIGLITAPAVLATDEEGNAILSTHDVLQATEDTVTVPIHDAEVIIKVEDSNVGTVP